MFDWIISIISVRIEQLQFDSNTWNNLTMSR